MATIGWALRKIKSQLDQFVSQEDIEQICREQGHRWRRRKLDPTRTIHLMLLQLLAGVALAGLRHLTQIKLSAQAISKARMRLPLSVLRQLLRRVCPAGPTHSRWQGLKVFIIDACSFSTADTQALRDKYGKAKNDRRSSRGGPAPKLLGVMDLAGGFIHRLSVLPWSRQERTCLSRLFSACGRKALLLGDRGLVGFAQMALMLRRKIHGCLRLPRWLVVHGAGKGNRRRVRQLGKQDMLLTWNKTRRVGWMSKRRWQGLPEQLTLRQIAFRIVRPGYRTHWAWLITTLIDPVKYPAQQVVDLYAKRWQIEVYFRDLKNTLGIKQITAKSVAQMRKQLTAFVILYNLVRRVMAKAAVQQHVDAARISFIDALRWLLWSRAGDPLPELIINAVRQRDTQPRMLKQVRSKYPPMNQPRHLLTKPASEAKL